MEPDIVGAVRYVRSRARFVLAACGVAAAVALAVSLALPKQYTAVCRILIDPPGGSDVRATTAVSPVYLESLRTYELFAASDDLFRRAVERFGLRGSTAIDTLKKRVLKVEIPRNTKVMEIYATLPDARKAHELALFLGRETVELTRASAMGGERERIAAAEREAAAAREQYDRAGQAWAEAIARGPVDPLSAELDADLTLRARLLRQFVTAEADPQDPRGAILRREVAAARQKDCGRTENVGRALGIAGASGRGAPFHGGRIPHGTAAAARYALRCGAGGRAVKRDRSRGGAGTAVIAETAAQRDHRRRRRFRARAAVAAGCLRLERPGNAGALLRPHGIAP